jgi:hypothetical protein
MRASRRSKLVGRRSRYTTRSTRESMRGRIRRCDTKLCRSSLSGVHIGELSYQLSPFLLGFPYSSCTLFVHRVAEGGNRFASMSSGDIRRASPTWRKLNDRRRAGEGASSIRSAGQSIRSRWTSIICADNGSGTTRQPIQAIAYFSKQSANSSTGCESGIRTNVMNRIASFVLPALKRLSSLIQCLIWTRPVRQSVTGTR